MGCGPSVAPPPAAKPAATSKAQPCLIAAPATPSPEYLEGNKISKPARPSFPPALASCGSWNDLMEAAEKGQNVDSLMRNHPIDGGDDKCWTALMEASERGHVNVVQQLLAGQANPNIYDKKGWTALMSANEAGSLPVAKLLIDAGAIVDMQDKKGWTALMEAAEKGNSPMVRLMVDSGYPRADLNITDQKGWTAFMAACEGGNVECVEYLWKHGAEHKMQDANRWTALEEARERGFKKIVAFMEPIVTAEKQLQAMLDTNNWSTEEAMRYLDDARKVHCMRVLVYKAEARLAESLVRSVSGKDVTQADRVNSFDVLVQLGHSNMVKEDDALRLSSIQICEDRLQRAVSGGQAQELKWAMSMAVRAELYPSTELEKAVDDAGRAYQKAANLPPEWDVKQMIRGLVEGRMLSKTRIDDEPFKNRMQALLDTCTKQVYTRDRRGDKVPESLQLLDVIHVQNEQLATEYTLRKQAVTDALSSSPPQLWGSSVLSNAKVEGRLELDAAINEVWLFHGTNEKAADSITENDFRLDLAGSNAGTLFGSGIYLAEAASKADEYTDPNGEGLRCMLLCRATLGRCLYVDSIETDPTDLTNKCISGEYNSVLGDREKCRGTYREFVVFDEDQVLPEYILLYRRVLKDD